MSFSDLIYVDQYRLDYYAESVLGSVAYDKVPVWKVGLQLTGPSAEGTQSREARRFSNREKLSAVIDALQEQGFLAKGRLSRPDFGFGEGPQFRLEVVRATRISIPVRSDDGVVNNLQLWYAPPPQGERQGFGVPGPLYVLQDGRANDEARFEENSSFSTLSALLTNLADSTTDGSSTNRYAQLARAFSVEAETSDELSERMYHDPVSAIAALGGQAFAARNVEILYRVRHVYSAAEPGHYPCATFAYAISISAPSL